MERGIMISTCSLVNYNICSLVLCLTVFTGLMASSLNFTSQADLESFCYSFISFIQHFVEVSKLSSLNAPLTSGCCRNKISVKEVI